MVDSTSMLITASISMTDSEIRTGATKRIADRPVDPIGLLPSERIIPLGHREAGELCRAYRPDCVETERGITPRVMVMATCRRRGTGRGGAIRAMPARAVRLHALQGPPKRSRLHYRCHRRTLDITCR